jgi:hypothetical protein
LYREAMLAGRTVGNFVAEVSLESRD